MIDRPTRTSGSARGLAGLRRLVSAIVLLTATGLAHPLAAQSTQAPLEQAEVRALVQGVADGNLSESRALAILGERCLAFEMTAFLVTDLTDAGASPAMIRALNGACVDRPAVTALSVEPSRAIMEVGARLEVAASVSDSQGTTLADRTLSWNTSDASIASVDRSGQIVARSPGLAVITAEVEASEGRVQVRVLPPTYSTSGVLATGLFLPGASQFRVKRPLRGALTILGTGGAIAWGLGAVETTQFCASPVGADGVCAPGDVLREETGRPNLVAGVAIGVGVMVLSAIDAALHGRSLTKEAERIRANPFGGGDGAGFGLSSDGSLTTSWRLRVR